jgi:hypothetical protein
MPSASLIIQDPNRFIHVVGGHHVIFDSDLAALYGVATKVLNQAVKRNIDRFPQEFRFQLTREEMDNLRSQIVTSSSHGGRRYLPYVFTEHGVLMAANVLTSPQAVAISVEVVRAFLRLRQMALSVEQLAGKLKALERQFLRHDDEIKVVFKAIQKLMAPPPASPKKQLGFHVK